MLQLLFGNIGLPEAIIIFVVILLLFGGKKIPELMHGLGKGVAGFRKGLNEIENEIKATPSSDSSEKETNA